MSVESGLTFFFIVFLFAITPGPCVFALLGRALVSGSASCLSLAVGMAVSDAAYLVLACLGLAAVAQHYAVVFALLRYAGALYLFFLAWKTWTTTSRFEESDPDRRLQGRTASFLQGFMISASNPKVILFYIAFLPTIIHLARLSVVDIAVAVALAVSALLFGFVLVSVSAASAGRLCRSSRAVKWLNRTAGAIMAGAGIYLVAR